MTKLRALGLPIGLLFPVSLLVVWEIAAHSGIGGRALIAPLEQIAQTAGYLAASGSLWIDLAATVGRVVAGFARGAVIGLTFGALIGTSRAVDRLTSPMFNALRQVPLTGWIPVSALLFGIGESAKLSLIALAVLYPIALNTADGLATPPTNYHELGRSLNFNTWTIWRLIRWPAAAPQILTGLKHGLAFAWIAAIAAELLLTSGRGLGSMIATGTTLFRLDIVMVGVILIGACGYVMSLGLGRLESKLLAYRTTNR